MTHGSGGRDWRGNRWLTGVLPTVLWLVALWLVGHSRVASLRVFVLVFVGFMAGMFLVPFTYHVVRAVLARNLWLPFERQPWGRHTFMANHLWQSAFRAPREPRRRTTVGLLVRYAVWGSVMCVMAYSVVVAARF